MGLRSLSIFKRVELKSFLEKPEITFYNTLGQSAVPIDFSGNLSNYVSYTLESILSKNRDCLPIMARMEEGQESGGNAVGSHMRYTLSF